MGSLNGLSFFILYSHCYTDFFKKCSQVLQRMFTKHRYNSLVEKGFMNKAQIILILPAGSGFRRKLWTKRKEVPLSW